MWLDLCASLSEKWREYLYGRIRDEDAWKDKGNKST